MNQIAIISAIVGGLALMGCESATPLTGQDHGGTRQQVVNGPGGDELTDSGSATTPRNPGGDIPTGGNTPGGAPGSGSGTEGPGGTPGQTPGSGGPGSAPGDTPGAGIPGGAPGGPPGSEFPGGPGSPGAPGDGNGQECVDIAAAVALNLGLCNLFGGLSCIVYWIEVGNYESQGTCAPQQFETPNPPPQMSSPPGGGLFGGPGGGGFWC